MSVAGRPVRPPPLEAPPALGALAPLLEAAAEAAELDAAELAGVAVAAGCEVDVAAGVVLHAPTTTAAAASSVRKRFVEGRRLPQLVAVTSCTWSPP
jgi:hypothetical protein